MFDVVKICYFKTYKLERNNACTQKVSHCDNTTLQIFFIFTMLNTYVPLIFNAKIQPKISSGSGEEVYLLHVKFQNCRSSSFMEEDVTIFVFKC